MNVDKTHVHTGGWAKDSTKVLDNTAECKKQKGKPLPSAQLLLEQELKYHTRHDDTKLQQQIISGRIVRGQVDEGQVIVEAIKRSRYEIEEENFGVRGDFRHQFMERLISQIDTSGKYQFDKLSA